MQILSKRALKISGLDIRAGLGNYPLDHRDPGTAKELRVCRKLRVISFREVLDGDIIEAANAKKRKAHKEKNAAFLARKKAEKAEKRAEVAKAETVKAKVEADKAFAAKRADEKARMVKEMAEAKKIDDSGKPTNKAPGKARK